MPTASFTAATWKELVSVIASGFALTPERASKLESNVTAKLIGALPYLAACREPERCAIAHLSSFVIGGAYGSARSKFDHKPSDDYDVQARLATLGGFEGGDPAILARGMKLLALVLIAGYKRDVEADAAAGRYNPVGKGVWDADAMTKRLAAEIDAVSAPEMDAILDARSALGNFWDI